MQCRRSAHQDLTPGCPQLGLELYLTKKQGLSMDNQHKMIRGYRDLTEAEIALMNKIKQHAEATKELCAEVSGYLYRQGRDSAEEVVKQSFGCDAEARRIADAESARWAAMAKTSLQQGAMFLIRAVAQPTTF
jgi:hypothetical protein